MREPGYYWVLYCGKWQPAEWATDDDGSYSPGPAWRIIGSDVDSYPDDGDVTSVGPKIEPPRDL